MGENTLVTRRQFLKHSGAAALAVSAPMLLSEESRGSNDKVTLGFIGLGGRGTALLRQFQSYGDVLVTGVCDSYANHRDRAAKLAGAQAKAHRDFRDLLEQKDVDAVVVASPAHWHGLHTVHACKAGKDVYVEKPLSHNIAEGEAMVKAARENERVVQLGTQIHGGSNYKRVVEIVRSGALGKISVVRTWLTCNDFPNGIGKPNDSSPPDGLDWDMWIGPAPLSAYNPAKFFGGQFRYFWDYGGGWMTGMGPHILDLAFWAMNLEPPLAAASSGGRYAIDDIAETPDTHEVVFDFPGLTMTWSQMEACSYGFELRGGSEMRRRLGVMFHGTNGTLVADYGQLEIFPEGDRMNGLELPASPPATDHYHEFIDSVMSRKLTSCDVAYAQKINIACHLGNISLRVGRKIRWNNEAKRIVGDGEAARLVGRDHREPWRL
jgi:predicted dehydrogenase